MKSLAFLLSLLAISQVGCSFKADPAPDSGFLKHTELLEEHRERFPFNKVWLSPRYQKERSRYDKLIVKPISLEYLMQTGDWKHVQIMEDEEIRAKARELARYYEEAIRNHLLSDKNKKFTQVDKSIVNTLILELAIVELIPTDVVRDALGEVTGLFVPGGGLLTAGAGGSIAFEARLRDAATNEVVGRFKDREQSRIRPIDLQGLTPYGFAREAIDGWAEQGVELLNSELSHKVADSTAITLKPW